MNSTNNIGKIENVLLETTVLNHCGASRNEVSVGPKFGVDVAVIDLPNELALVLTSDPLSLIPSLGLQESAWLSVHLMANDMATTGFAPMYAQFVLNLSPSLSNQDFTIYWKYIHQFCKEIGVAITGGHTGQIEGQNSTIAGGGTMALIAKKNKILTSQQAIAGHSIIVTKECAISSTAILAMSFPETVKNKLGTEVYQDGCELFYQTSSLKDALIAVDFQCGTNEITAMHDVTEGGVLGAVYELATAAGCGANIYSDQLPLGHTQQQIATFFQFDPKCALGAGAMIIIVEKKNENKIIERLKNNGIKGTVIGETMPKENGIILIKNEIPQQFIPLKKDPYWSAFFEATKKGWK